MDTSRILGSGIAATRVTSPPLASKALDAQKPATSFSEHVKAAISEANQNLNTAEARATEVATDQGDIVETMTALSRAELSLRHVVTLRNRVLESYQQIMRLQL